MSQTTASPASGGATADRAEFQSMLFLELVAQQANLALIFLGQVPHPETGQRVCELDAARHFVDQLEMLETKTRGNLNKREETLLKQSLMTARMAFVNVAQNPSTTAPSNSPAAETKTDPPAAAATPESPLPPSPPANPTPPEGSPGAGPDDERKKFVKKY